MGAGPALRVASVDVPGHAFSTQVLRGGTGTPLVYLHGLQGVSPADPLATALAGSFDLYAPVHPGFRELAEVDDLRDVHDLALYHDDLLHALGLGPVAVVGHSFGAMVAAELAAHVPSRVSRLVLAAPFGLWRDDDPVADLFPAFPLAIQELVWANPSSPAAQEVAATVAAAVSGEDDRVGHTGDEPLAMLIEMIRGLATVGKYIWPIPDKGLRRRLHRITAPTLVVWGAKDRLVPASYADDFVAGIGNARVEIIDDAGHMVPFEAKEAFLGLTRSFVS